MGGALPEAELFRAVQEVGLVDARVVQRHAAFADTSSGEQVADHLELRGVTFFARKPR